jgi:hypothetical protein
MSLVDVMYSAKIFGGARYVAKLHVPLRMGKMKRNIGNFVALKVTSFYKIVPKMIIMRRSL